MKLRKLITVLGLAVLPLLGVCLVDTADVNAYDKGSKMCGTIVYDGPNNTTQSFRICGLMGDNGRIAFDQNENGGFSQTNWNNALTLEQGDWNSSVMGVSLGLNLNSYGMPGMDINGSRIDVFSGSSPQTFRDFVVLVRNQVRAFTGNAVHIDGSALGGVSYDYKLRAEIIWSNPDNPTHVDPKVQEGDVTGNAAGGSGANTNACYSNAGGLGWVLCPIITAATGGINGLYGILEEDYLKIDVVNIFGQTGSNNSSQGGVYDAWAIFRNIANIVFIILFLVVILSQLTGFGIDNYGIKKILPRLIIVAILINLSYIICQLAVDASNIIGVGLRGFLEGLVDPGVNVGVDPDGVQWTVAIGGMTIALGAVLSAAVYFAGIGVLFAILGVAITGFIAVFFLWLILVIRSAGVILLVAIAPLAIACYLLPNTESIGKRWLNIFKALLILYPLCSLVIGVGAMAGHILSNSTNEVMHLAAMLVQVVPFFFIPMLLKQSLAGMGNLGAKLSGIGRAQGAKLGGKAQQALNNTNFAQNRRFNAMKRRTKFANKRLPGSAQTQARRLAALEKMESQELAGSRLLARQDLGRAEERFNLLSNKGNLSKKEQAELNGIISEFANTPGYANKIVKKISEGGATAAFTQAVASHAAANSDVSAAINGKNATMARYLADVANGKSDVSAATSYNSYATPEKLAQVAAGLSDREVASQSPESMRALLNAGDSERITQIANDDRIMGNIDAENAELLRDARDMTLNIDPATGRQEERRVGFTASQRGTKLRKFNERNNLSLSNEGWSRRDSRTYEKVENGKTYSFDTRTGDFSVS